MLNIAPAIPAAGEQAARQTGIEVVGAVPWGTHFCQFYETSQDLIETLVPYFREGLAANEFCMWITSAPLEVEEARSALRAAVPNVDDAIARGQIEVLDYSQWYTLSGVFDSDRVLRGWQDKLANARQRGYEGLRLTGNTFWLEQATWQDFARYEEAVNNVIGQERMLALCTYSLRKCGASEILDVVVNHEFALIKRLGQWEIIESAHHKKTEEALRASEERYRTLFESMTEGFALHEIILDDQGRPCDYRFLEMNPAFESLTGLNRTQVLGRRVREALPNVEPFWIETYGRVAQTGEPVRFESYTAALHRCYEVFAYRPAPNRFATIFFDVTELNRAQTQLEEERARWQATVESMLNPLAVCDARGQMVYMNTASVRYTQMEVEPGLDMDAHPAHYQLYRLDGTLFQAEDLPMQKAALTGRPVREVEVIQRLPGGQERVAIWNAAPLRGADGRVAGAVAVGHDVTERRAAARERERLLAEVERRAAELAQANEQLQLQAEEMETQAEELTLQTQELEAHAARLEEANAELDSFAYSVSHDLRAPLRAIDGFSRMLEDGAHQSSDETLRLVGTVRRNVRKMNNLLDDLLRFSRLTSQALNPALVDMERLVAQALDDLSNECRERQVEWSISPLASCQGDAALLKQVWVNLLSNALKYTRKRDRARIEIGCRAQTLDGKTTYYVCDNGTGFNMAYASKLFGVFQRLHRAEEYEGTGVGLAIVQRIVRRHGGRVWAEAEVDRGATFYFSL